VHSTRSTRARCRRSTRARGELHAAVHWVDDPRLSATRSRSCTDWVSDGFALGVEKSIPEPQGTTLPGVTKILQPVEPFVAAGDRDQFTCFILDPAPRSCRG